MFEVRHATATGTEGLFRVRENGDLDQKGTAIAGSQTFDLAEFFPANETLEPGDVVVIDPAENVVAGTVVRSFAPMQQAVVGVVTTKPGIILGGAFADETYFPELARACRVAEEAGALVVRSERKQFAGEPFNLPALAASFATSTLIFAAGIAYFERVERRFADWI